VPLPAELANDGVPEFIEVMVGPEVAALRGAVILNAIDTGGSWKVGPDAGADGTPSASQAQLNATASDLVLMLYRRLPVPDADVDGDPILVASLLALADTS
jgi:hypothetical protein